MDKIMRIYCERESTVFRKLQEAGLTRAEVCFDCGDVRIRLPFASEEEGYLLEDTFSDCTYSYDDRGLNEILVAELEAKGLTMSTAESCTGGMVASAIVDVAGASDVFYEGMITYHNNAKMDRLGVEEDTLATYGAVSAETAVEMASGLLNDYVSIAIATTGIAGPGGGTDEKPVGLVFVAVATDSATEVHRHIFLGSRNQVRRYTGNAALFYAIQHIRNNF